MLSDTSDKLLLSPVCVSPRDNRLRQINYFCSFQQNTKQLIYLKDLQPLKASRKLSINVQYNVSIWAVISTAVGGAVTNVGNSLLRKNLPPPFLHICLALFQWNICKFPCFYFIFFLNNWAPPNVTKLILSWVVSIHKSTGFASSNKEHESTIIRYTWNSNQSKICICSNHYHVCLLHSSWSSRCSFCHSPESGLYHMHCSNPHSICLTALPECMIFSWECYNVQRKTAAAVIAYFIM